MVEIIEQPRKHAQPIGRVVEVLGNYADPGMEIEIALRKHDLPHEFSRDGRAGDAKLPDERARGKDLQGPRATCASCRSSRSTARPRRTSTTRSTAEREGKGFRLWVAIADVSHYVQHGDALDREALRARQLGLFPAARDSDAAGEALQRARARSSPTSIACAWCARWTIAADGEIEGYEFYPA